MSTVRDAVLWAAKRLISVGIEDPWANAGFLMSSLLEDQALEKHVNRVLTEPEEEKFRHWVAQREQRVPAQYIVGYQTFYDLRIMVSPDVFIPRSYTEHYVREVLNRLANRAEHEMAVAEIGTGSGAVAIAIAVNEPRARVFATEVKETTLALAMGNAKFHGVAARVEFLKGKGVAPILHAGLEGKISALVANPPDLTPEEVKELVPEGRYEPVEALTAGEADPLAIHLDIIRHARNILQSSGFVALHVRPQLAERLAGAVRDAGFRAESIPMTYKLGRHDTGIPGQHLVYPITIVGVMSGK